jgi:hypothetical protein
MINILTVYDEDLLRGDLSAATISGSKVLAAGSTQGALAVTAIAKGSVSLTSDVVITLSHADSENGVFSELEKLTIPASSQFADKEVMATYILPPQTKAYVSAAATSAKGNEGGVRVLFTYQAR